MDTFADIAVEKKNMQYDRFNADPLKRALHYFLNDCAKKHAGKIAVKFNGQGITYKELYETSNKLAKLLIYSGVRTGDVIGIAIDRSTEMIVALLAILKSGAAYLPLDPQYPQDRIEFMLNDSSAKILLTSKKYQQHFHSGATEILLEDAFEKLDDYTAEEPEISIGGSELAYILYTSGSTGRPKGAMIRHYSLVNLLMSTQKVQQLNVGDKVLANTTISFDMACTEIFLPLVTGAQLVVATTEIAKDGWLILETLRNEQINYMVATPYTWRMVLEAGWDKPLPLRIGIGGEAFTRELASKLIPLCYSLWNQYGPTETTIYSLQKRITDADDITLGKPVDNTQVFILDENLNPITDGSMGEIYIAGYGVAKGYINRPELTAQRFVDNPFSGKPGDKMYRTGDLGKFTSNGEIQFFGRIDQQVKVRGFRIELEEIEQALLQQKDIREAVVIAREDIPGNKRLAAYVVLTHKPKANSIKSRTTAIQRALKGSLPDHMVPDDVVFMESIPVTLNGKIDRKLLPKPQLNLADDNGEYVAPRTDTEKLLANMWQDLMEIEKISVTDDFFTLGGHSLVAVQIMARIEKATGKRLRIATLFEHSTIEKLAICLDVDDQPVKWRSLVPIKPKGSKTPLYIIHGEGLDVLCFNSLARQMDIEQPVYGLQARGLKGETPLEVIEDIAYNYIIEIVAQNPDGPYIIAGYSFGGYIAVEMRKQMTAMGKDVKIIIFDTDAEKSKDKGWIYLFPRKTKRHLQRLSSAVKTSVNNPAAAVKNMFEKPSKTPGKAISNREALNFYRQIQKIKEKLYVALYNYPLVPFDDKVYLFRADTCTHYVVDTETLGWKKIARKGVEIFHVPGDHLSMLLSPNVEEFAPSLQAVVDKISSTDFDK